MFNLEIKSDNSTDHNFRDVNLTITLRKFPKPQKNKGFLNNKRCYSIDNQISSTVLITILFVFIDDNDTPVIFFTTNKINRK
jgi:hypothetical protein